MVRVEKKTPLFKKKDGEHRGIGCVFKGAVLKFDKQNAQNMKERYFRLQVDNCYTLADHMVPEQTEENSVKKISAYLPSSENVVTRDSYVIQSEAGDKPAKVTQKVSHPIYTKDKDRYDVQLGSTLVYTLKYTITATKYADSTSGLTTRRTPVFMYHYFHSKESGEVSKNRNWLEINDFGAQLKCLKEHNYVTLRIQDVENFLDGRVQLPRDGVSITIDNGTASICKYAYPLLKEHGDGATLFLIGNRLKDDRLL